MESGDKMPDGTIYLGISQHNGRPMYAAPTDAPLKMDFNEAAQYARELAVGDKNDWRLPAVAELDQLFVAQKLDALRGTFAEASIAWAHAYVP